MKGNMTMAITGNASDQYFEKMWNMRPLEILLLLANLLTFFGLSVWQLRTTRWIRYLVFMALLVMGAQLLIEGPRWQMIPAYALSGVFFLVWLFQSGNPAREGSRRNLAGRFAAGLVIGLGILGLVISIVLPIIIPVFRFTSNRPYGIGTVTYHWVDADLPERHC
jgi:hypothetical protein